MFEFDKPYIDEAEFSLKTGIAVVDVDKEILMKCRRYIDLLTGNKFEKYGLDETHFPKRSVELLKQAYIEMYKFILENGDVLDYFSPNSVSLGSFSISGKSTNANNGIPSVKEAIGSNA